MAEETEPVPHAPKSDKAILEAAASGLKTGKVVREKNWIEYARFKEHCKGIERGTAVVKGRIIRAYPHIKRIFTLGKGIAHNMEGVDKVFLEEKIDGFNVRIVYIDKQIFGFSRGGFLESFITEKARGLKLERFFKDNPGYVLCGEMIGNTPFTKPTDDFDVRLYIFDIDDGAGNLLGPEERYRLLERYGIGYAPRLGSFRTDDMKGIMKVALSLNKGRKEGMVIKSRDRKKVLKYVTANSDLEDIAQCSNIFFDMPLGFYHQRILRSSYFIKDFGFDRKKYALKLGEAFYDGLEGALNEIENGGSVDEEFEISIEDLSVWDDIRKHMGREVRLEELWRKTEKDGRTRIRFRKIFKKTTKLIASYMNGKGVTD